MTAIIVIFLPPLEGDEKVLVMPPLEADEKEVKEKREIKVLKCKQDINQAFNIKAGNISYKLRNETRQIAYLLY